MKVATKISPRKFICEPGRVKAEGKTASPTFCYRVKTKGGMLRKSMIELHSRVTGRKIGYIGKSPRDPLARDQANANRWTELVGSHINSPKDVNKKMQHFLKVAQQPSRDPKITESYRQISLKAWKTINREARRT